MDRLPLGTHRFGERVRFITAASVRTYVVQGLIFLTMRHINSDLRALVAAT